MKISAIFSVVSAMLVLSAADCAAEPIWDTGKTLFEVIGYDIQSHDAGMQLTDYQTNAVCMLLGYFRGFAEASAVASHYDATSMPFVLPDSINNEQIERVVYQYLKENPDRLGMKGDALVVAALAKAYPNPSFTPPLGSK